jgi:hypothetical protein
MKREKKHRNAEKNCSTTKVVNRIVLRLNELGPNEEVREGGQIKKTECTHCCLTNAKKCEGKKKRTILHLSISEMQNYLSLLGET